MQGGLFPVPFLVLCSTARPRNARTRWNISVETVYASSVSGSGFVSAALGIWCHPVARAENRPIVGTANLLHRMGLELVVDVADDGEHSWDRDNAPSISSSLRTDQNCPSLAACSICISMGLASSSFPDECGLGIDDLWIGVVAEQNECALISSSTKEKFPCGVDATPNEHVLSVCVISFLTMS